jgi:hypothetical protein
MSDEAYYGRCDACGEGRLVAATGPGRMVWYRRGQRAELPADHVVPTCDRCGAMRYDHATISLIAALGRARDAAPAARRWKSLARSKRAEADGWWDQLCAVGRALDAAGVPAFGPPHHDGSREMWTEPRRVAELAAQRDAVRSLIDALGVDLVIAEDRARDAETMARRALKHGLRACEALRADHDAALALVRDIARGGYLREEDYSCCYCGELIVAGLGHRSDCPWTRAVELTDTEAAR